MDRLDLQVEVDVVEDVDMHMKVKQIGGNMWLQIIIVLRPFLDFMDSFKLSKAHNMFALIWNP
jgi:hypothetical protein